MRETTFLQDLWAVSITGLVLAIPLTLGIWGFVTVLDEISWPSGHKSWPRIFAGASVAFLSVAVLLTMVVRGS